MKLSSFTIDILENFTRINNSMFIKATPEGEERTKVTVLMDGKGMYAEAYVPEVFPHNISLYNVNGFLNLIKDMKNSEFEVKRDRITVTEKNHTVEYYMCDPELFLSTSKPHVFIDGDYDFILKHEEFSSLRNTADIFKSTLLEIYSKDGNIYLETTAQGVSNVNKLLIGSGNIAFPSSIDIGKMRLIKGDYEVRSNSEKVEFKSVDIEGLTYVIGHKV